MKREKLMKNDSSPSLYQDQPSGVSWLSLYITVTRTNLSSDVIGVHECIKKHCFVTRSYLCISLYKEAPL